MHFIANVATNGDGHKHNLRIEAREKHLAELGGRRRERGRHAGEVDHVVSWGAGVGLEGRHCAEDLGFEEV